MKGNVQQDCNLPLESNGRIGGPQIDSLSVNAPPRSAACPDPFNYLTLAFIVLVVGLGVIWWIPALLAVQDLPNHLAKDQILLDLFLNSESRFRNIYEFRPVFQACLLGDLLLGWIARGVGTDLGGRIIMTIGSVAVPLFVYVLLRVRAVDTNRALLGGCFATFLATNWFFLSGYTNYELSFCCSILTLVFWERWTRVDGGLRFFYFGAFTISALCTYLFHLAPFLFLGLIVGAFGACRLRQRKLNFVGVTASLSPLICIWILDMWSKPPGRAISSPNAFYYREWPGKLYSIVVVPFVRWDKSTDLLLCAGLALICMFWWMVVRRSREPRWGTGSLEAPLAFLLIVASYFALPMGAGVIYDVDARAIPVSAVLLIVIGIENLGTINLSRRSVRIAIAGSVLILASNIYYVFSNLEKLTATAQNISAAVLALPPNQRLLPIMTNAPVGRMYPYLHFPTRYALDRHGTDPYVFTSANSPSVYFHANYEVNVPWSLWYTLSPSSKLDLRRVSEQYDYVLVTLPYDVERINTSGMSVFYRNDDVEVFKILSTKLQDRSVSINTLTN